MNPTATDDRFTITKETLMNLQRLRTVLGKGTQHLGDIVFWQLADARVDRATLESLWRGAGLDAALLPEEPTAERALKQAVREAQIGQRDRLIRLGLDSDDEIVFAIVRENRDDAGNVTYLQEARVRLERASETITSDVASHDIAQAVIDGFRTLRTTHTSDDVRRAIVKVLGTWAAVTLRDGGGIYWVPTVYAAELRRLQTAVEKIGASRVHVLPVHESQDASRALGAIATASLEAELAQLQTEIAAFVSTPPERTSTLTRRLEAFAALRERAKLYRSVLAITVTDLDRQLDEMSATVDGMLHKKAA
ncbi:MAG TPA: DUF6744 family protein [Kofleriaceae bacterium]|nr:DUF6744 family protein [Kofleriaceae bacterium]